MNILDHQSTKKLMEHLMNYFHKENTNKKHYFCYLIIHTQFFNLHLEISHFNNIYCL